MSRQTECQCVQQHCRSEDRVRLLRAFNRRDRVPKAITSMIAVQRLRYPVLFGFYTEVLQMAC